MMLDDKTRLRHISDAANTAIKICGGLSREDLDKEEVYLLALVQLLGIIGEASKYISPELKAKYSEVPWKIMAGMRDKLYHGYFDVDPEIV